MNFELLKPYYPSTSCAL